MLGRIFVVFHSAIIPFSAFLVLLYIHTFVFYCSLTLALFSERSFFDYFLFDSGDVMTYSDVNKIPDQLDFGSTKGMDTKKWKTVMFPLQFKHFTLLPLGLLSHSFDI